MSTVYITAGGLRFHGGWPCSALDAGLRLAGYRYSPQGVRQHVRAMSATAAARAGYTACRVCVPARFALPAIGEKFGHERLTINPSCCGADCCGGREEREVCVRCSNDVSRRHGWNWSLDVSWPCMSAVVLGLAPRDGAL